VVTSRFVDEDVPPGTRGYVIEIHADGNFEIEVSDPSTGKTLALFVAAPDEVQLDT
jgi:hypothetical protein